MTILLRPDRKISLPRVAQLRDGDGHDVNFSGPLAESSNLLGVRVFVRWSARALALRHTSSDPGKPWALWVVVRS
jgi:hypothetical protein